uniref:CARD domain-containing protein n=1 Tax=Esox lucius TaxID=8010 RepID=A0A3P9A6G7_ESOLU
MTISPGSMTIIDAAFVDENRKDLIQRVTIVMTIADDLLQRGMIDQEMYNNIKALRTTQDKMRELYIALNSGGVKVKSTFYTILLNKEPYLVQDLGKGETHQNHYDKGHRWNRKNSLSAEVHLGLGRGKSQSGCGFHLCASIQRAEFGSR